MTDPAPLGVYVHWPYCARICPYCDFNVVRDRGQAEQAQLARAILEDLAAHAALTGPRRLVSVFFGGGTPSLMAPGWAAEILDQARRLWPGEEPLEVTLEANPTDAEAGRFAALRHAGIERLSLGLQSIRDESLAMLGRNHSAAEGLAALKTALGLFPRVSADLIYALPEQQPDAWAEELTAVADLGVGHVSPYQLTIEAGTAFDRAVRRGRLAPPEAERAAELYETTQDALGRLGFEAYEVSNHARGTADRSRHNLVYWRGEEFVGVGPGAHGRLRRPEGLLATRAERRVGDYIRAVAENGTGWAEAEILTRADAAQERLLMGLRTIEGVGLQEIPGLAAPEVLRELEAAGLIRVEAARLHATAAGRPVLDRIIAELAG